MPRPRSLIAAAAAAAAAVGLAPAAAHAAPSSLTRSSTLLIYTGDGGADNVTVAASGANTTLTLGSGGGSWPAASGTFPPAGCTRDSATVLTCSTVSTSEIIFNVNNGADAVNASAATWKINFNGGADADTMTGGSSDDVGNGGTGDDRLQGQNGNDALDGNEGNDTVTGGEGNDSLNGAAGNDSVSGNGGNDTIDTGPNRDTGRGDDGNDKVTGGTGADSLLGGANDDTLNGGDDRDTLTPGEGKDAINGGNGFDVVTYQERRPSGDNLNGVTIILDGQPNDGRSGEGDNVGVDVEDATGGEGPDVIVGDDQANVLDGNGGNDRIEGRGGVDQFIGGNGDDEIVARDGNREQTDCGTGADRVVGDDIDVPVECETQDKSADLVSDADGDGISKPADCNDADPKIRPGAAEIPDNGVDEDCDTKDATNPDRDGDNSPRPADCDDGNPNIRPGGTEIKGNSTDEDCSGLADPFPRILSGVNSNYLVFLKFTMFSSFFVRNIPAGTTLKVTCRGRGCPRKLPTRTFKKKTKRFELRKTYFRRAKLRPRAKVDVLLTKPGSIGKHVRVTIKNKALAKTETRCLPVGAKKAKESKTC